MEADSQSGEEVEDEPPFAGGVHKDEVSLNGFLLFVFAFVSTVMGIVGVLAPDEGRLMSVYQYYRAPRWRTGTETQVQGCTGSITCIIRFWEVLWNSLLKFIISHKLRMSPV